MKQIAFLKKKDGLSREAFIRLYEEEHAKLIARLLPFYTHYRRSYPIISDPAARGNFAHDAIMEMWFADAAQQVAMGKRISEPDVGEEMRVDEERLFDRSAMIMFTVDEQGMEDARFSSVPRRKIIILARKRPDVSRDALISHQEDVAIPHFLSVIESRGIEAPRSFIRNYPVPGGTFKMPHLDTAAYPVDFDAIIELGFDDHDAIRPLLAEDMLAGLIGDRIDPAHTIILDVEEYSSAQL